MYFNN